MSLPLAWPQVLDFFGTPLAIQPSRGQLSSDAGLLPVRQFDQRIGLTPTLRRHPDEHRDRDDQGLASQQTPSRVRSGALPWPLRLTG